MGKRGGGRPKWKPNPMQIEQAKDWAKTGATREQIAYALGIHPATLYRYMERYPDSEFCEGLKKGKALAVVQVAGKLFLDAMDEKSRTKTVSRIFFLKAQGGWREKIELPDEPMKVVHGVAPSVQKLLRELRELSKKK